MRVHRGLAAAPRRVLMALVRGYRFWLSPWLGTRCLYLPTCSAYALQALERHGALAGTYLTVARIARCGPWCPAGCDPVPDEAPRLFRRLLPGDAARASAAASPSPSPDKNTP